jgi:hypothetical protein
MIEPCIDSPVGDDVRASIRHSFCDPPRPAVRLVRDTVSAVSSCACATIPDIGFAACQHRLADLECGSYDLTKRCSRLQFAAAADLCFGKQLNA